MSRIHGISNANLMRQLSNSLSASGIIRFAETAPGNFVIDMNQPVAMLQKTSAMVGGAGRLVIGKGQNYIPSYTLGVGAPAGSGYTVPSDGVYQVDAVVSVSGVAIETYGGVVLVNGVAASGTGSFADSDARGAAAIKINGVVTAVAGQVINVGVKALHGNLTTIGSEDLVHAPAANLRVVKLGASALTYTGS